MGLQNISKKCVPKAYVEMSSSNCCLFNLILSFCQAVINTP